MRAYKVELPEKGSKKTKIKNLAVNKPHTIVISKTYTFHFKFRYYNRMHHKIEDVTEALEFSAFLDGVEIVDTKAECKDGIHIVKIKPTKILSKEDKAKLHFAFESNGRWIFTETEDAEPNVVTCSGGKWFFDGKQRHQYYDLPAKWDSRNWNCTKDSTASTFAEEVTEETSESSPIVFNLDEIVLLDREGGTQDIYDENHFPEDHPKYKKIPIVESQTSRIKLFHVIHEGHIRDVGKMELYKQGGDGKSSRIPFTKNLIELPTDKDVRIVFFRNGFYPIGHERTVEEPGWVEKGFVVGARAAVRNDPAIHVQCKPQEHDCEHGHNGDYELHHFKDLSLDQDHLISYLITYCSLAFLRGQKSEDDSCEPASASELKEFMDTHVYAAMDHHNEKRLVYENLSPTDDAITVKTFHFIDERETFEMTDMPLSVNEYAQQPKVSEIRENATGGMPNLLASARAGMDPLFDHLDIASTRQELQIGEDRPSMDPNSVKSFWTGPDLEIENIVKERQGNPRTAEVVAAALAKKYGPFRIDKDSSPGNRARIIENLMWIADDGIEYDDSRADSFSLTTYSPNHTVSNRTGVCRDIHTAISAILASLVDAKKVDGVWVPGSPNNQEGINVQTFGFATAAESHAFTFYRDPEGGWNAIEYGSHYKLKASSDVEALSMMTHSPLSEHRYRIDGWNGGPYVDSDNTLGAENANWFFQYNPGMGKAGDLSARYSLGGGLLSSYFITPHTSIVGEVTPTDNGARGGLKINVQGEERNVKGGSLKERFALGIYTDCFDFSTPGERGTEQRTRYHAYILGAQVDGSYRGREKEILGEHLKAKLGLDWSGRLAIPVWSGGGKGLDFSAATLSAFAKAEGAGDLTFSGHEEVSDNLELDWAMQVGAVVDLKAVINEALSSGGKSVDRTLLKDPLRTHFTIGLTHRTTSGNTTKIEVGGTQFLAAPYGKETLPSETHYATFSYVPESGKYQFGIFAKGQTLDEKFIPANAIGAALEFRPRENLKFGIDFQTEKEAGGKIGRIIPSLSAGYTF